MIHYDIVKSEDDVKAVVDLVRKVYTDTGYIAADLAHKVDLVSHTYIDRRDAVTIMAVMKNTKSLLGTVSVISDISEGVLPMDVVKSKVNATNQQATNTLTASQKCQPSNRKLSGFFIHQLLVCQLSLTYQLHFGNS